MANEFTFSGTFQFLKSLARVSASTTTTKTIAGSQCSDNTQVIGTTYEPLVFGDMGTTPGVFMLQNLDTTNYVEVSSDGGSTYCIRLAPGGLPKRHCRRTAARPNRRQGAAAIRSGICGRR